MLDVLTIGRVGVDIYPLQVATPLAEVETFGKFLGGSPTNVAVAASQYGLRAGVITRTGADAFAEYVHRALRDFGVDDSQVRPVPGLPTPVTFCEIYPPDHFPLWFYRTPTAPDLQIHPEELDLAAIEAAGVFWLTGTGLCQRPSRDAHTTALAARGGRAHTVLDLDYRPMFWSDPAAATAAYAEVLPRVTVAVGNLDEAEVAVGVRDPERAARLLLDRGPRLAVVKLGPDGVLASTGEETVRVPPVPVEVVNGLGAGDAFGGALCLGLLRDWPLERTLRFANAAGAIVASRLSCSAAMPDEAETSALAATIQPEPAPATGGEW
ncbi:5-dehydro-2-deoxygluconokinase [Micromonospora globispora]|uniref:5-dehydro-2-deoxygluconokinase n=1 Tax=Micromonospora globispora TaxID=1450148 RepID=A0A317JYM3_9ACTN|nr:5-dehydro-2-deoxygluconokinase [Micromonospora globispora]PWU45400.1 5-dehydro-2-deoxygluconokinase [Micromonospora globispora]RQW97380.1 5-dehydro-2-deoxygluconokinase [Micromonospora globispora]